jgi:predicted GNAT family acetyltransferase
VTTTVTENHTANRYEIIVDNAGAGFTEYHLHQQVIAFLHTEITPAFTGKGLAGVLIRAALDDVRARGLHVQPFCSFVRGFIAKNQDYLTLVAPDERARFRL